MTVDLNTVFAAIAATALFMQALVWIGCKLFYRRNKGEVLENEVQHLNVDIEKLKVS